MPTVSSKPRPVTVICVGFEKVFLFIEIDDPLAFFAVTAACAGEAEAMTSAPAIAINLILRAMELA
jgi:hypothetical protein